ncbi:hypothetical protein KJ611_01770 [Patescibacteria group bacterium]|nr:hypothetical protein [Patescibacteria group bacterium]MBU1705129.1 hypothetical protein [Patescibacteria group bacterium]
MKINDLLHNLEPDSEMTILNEPFSFAGQIEITLEGGEVLHWLFSNEGDILSVAPHNEELFFFQPLDEEIEPQGEVFFFRNKEYELDYEGAGTVTAASEDSGVEEEDQYSFMDYEADNGELIRQLHNLNTGEEQGYLGKIVVEEDILNIE